MSVQGGQGRSKYNSLVCDVCDISGRLLTCDVRACPLLLPFRPSLMSSLVAVLARGTSFQGECERNFHLECAGLDKEPPAGTVVDFDFHLVQH